MENKNLRKLKCTVTAQTLYHLEHMAAVSGYKDVGRVIDKIVRERQLAFSEKKERHKDAN